MARYNIRKYVVLLLVIGIGSLAFMVFFNLAGKMTSMEKMNMDLNTGKNSSLSSVQGGGEQTVEVESEDEGETPPPSPAVFNDKDKEESKGPSSSSSQNHDHATISGTCVGDRLQHKVELSRNSYICSKNGQFFLGLNEDGRFVWKNVTRHEKHTKKLSAREEAGETFVLTENGDFLVFSTSTVDTKDLHGVTESEEGTVDYNVEDQEIDKVEVNWFRKVNVDGIQYSYRCLPKYDCPYLHLHNDGVTVLNWIDNEGSWNERNIKKLFDNLGL